MVERRVCRGVAEVLQRVDGECVGVDGRRNCRWAGVAVVFMFGCKGWHSRQASTDTNGDVNWLRKCAAGVCFLPTGLTSTVGDARILVVHEPAIREQLARFNWGR